MAIRVYVWVGEFPGHAAMAYRNHDDKYLATQKYYFSWYPAETKNVVHGLLANRLRRMPKNYLSDKLKQSDEQGKVRSADYKFTFYHLDDQAVLNYWQSLIESDGSGGEYQFLRRNCSTTVARALRAGNPGVAFPTHLVWKPEHVLLYCSEIYRNLDTNASPFARSDVKLQPASKDLKLDTDAGAPNLKVTTQLAANKVRGSDSINYKPKYWRHKWNDVVWEVESPNGDDMEF